MPAWTKDSLAKVENAEELAIASASIPTGACSPCRDLGRFAWDDDIYGPLGGGSRQPLVPSGARCR